MSKDSDTPICEMEFATIGANRKATVRLWRPVFDKIKDVWFCWSEIVGLEEGELKRAYGSDPFQAIILSLTRFRLIFERQGEDFATSDGCSYYVVFPKFVPWVYGLDVYRELCATVDERVQEIEDERTRRREGRE
jgi:hypothetical protein